MILDHSNHTYKTGNGGGCMWGMDVGGGGYGWRMWGVYVWCVMRRDTVQL